MDQNTCPSPPAPVNYKSDFAFYLDLYAITGYDDEGKPILEPIGFPDYDWVAKFTTERMSVPFVASSKGGVLTNCRNDNGRILIVANRHNLCPGRLSVDFRADLPSDLYPDGTQLHALPSVLNIELTRHAAPCPSAIEAKLILPYIKGKDAYEYAVEHGYAGTADEFGKALSEVPNKQNKLTASDDFSLTDQGGLSLTERAKRAVFDDLWKAAVDSRGDVDHSHFDEDGCSTPYLCCKVWLTYEEAVFIYSLGPTTADCKTAIYRNQRTCRTFLPSRINAYAVQGTYTYANCSALEAVDAGGLFIPSNSAFFGCKNLREILKMYSINSNVSNIEYQNSIYSGCASLENIAFDVIYPYSFSLADCPLLDIAVFRRIVTRYAGAAIITITVHPDVYAKLTDSGNAEWHQVLLDAIAKNISLATV